MTAADVGKPKSNRLPVVGDTGVFTGAWNCGAKKSTSGDMDAAGGEGGAGARTGSDDTGADPKSAKFASNGADVNRNYEACLH